MLYVPDLPGFGDSDEAPAESCIQTLVDAIIVSLDTLLSGRRTLDLAGFSLGGVVSAHVAVQRGAVRRLALLGSPGSETPSRRKGELIRWRNAADDAAQNAALQHNLLTHMMYAQRNIDALAFRAYADSIKAARFRSRDRAHAIPLNEILKSYSKPVRFMYGEHDVICTPALAKHSLENTLARRECRVIQASGHWVQLERADTVNDELARWFATAAVTEQAQCLA